MADEYIKRESMHKSLDDLSSEHLIGNDDDTFISLAKAHDRIEELPVADVVEVVHGEWVENITYHNANSLFREYGFDVAETLLYHTCSCCNALGSNSFNYCPNCGAKMDGENNE